MPILDTTGLACPLPVLKARKALAGLKPGEVLEIEATDPAASRDFPAFCASAGHELVEAGERAGRLVFKIRKGAPSRAPE
ncbi:MAG: sulfurtransferase TusA family protein [Alphaproteobacteria bacterium]|nr:sulfurtransferase TusA family protein [Alphaproteobacteria bacterium]